MPSSFRQPPTSNWHKICWIDCLFFCFYVVSSLKKRTTWKCARFVLFRPIKKRSSNLLSVSDLCPKWWLIQCGLTDFWNCNYMTPKLSRLYKIIWNRVDCRRYVKDPKTHNRLKRTLFNQTKQCRMRIFEEILWFQSCIHTYIHTHIHTQTHNSFIFCQCDACGRRKKNKHSTYVSLVHSSFRKNPTGKR